MTGFLFFFFLGCIYSVSDICVEEFVYEVLQFKKQKQNPWILKLGSF